MGRPETSTHVTLDRIPTDTVIGLMVYSFVRIGAVTKLKVGDYYQSGKRFFVGLHERRQVP